MKKIIIIVLILSAITLSGTSLNVSAEEISNNSSNESVTTTPNDVLINDKIAQDHFNKIMEKEHQKSKPESVQVVDTYMKIQDTSNGSSEYTTQTQEYNKQQFEQEINKENLSKSNIAQDNGWIKLTLEIDKQGSGNGKVYGFYEWLTYPKIAFSDIISLGHDANLNFNFADNYAENYFEYTDNVSPEIRYFYDHLTPNNTSNRILDVGGIGYKFNLIGNTSPAGCNWTCHPYGLIYTSITSGASNNGPVTFTYAHQQFSISFGGLGFSIPAGGSLNLNWASYYDKFTVADTAHL